jgi:hypothetical protein
MDGTCQARDFVGGNFLLLQQKSKSHLSTSIRLRIAMLNNCWISTRTASARHVNRKCVFKNGHMAFAPHSD